MEESKLLKISWIILTVNIAFGMVCSVVNIIDPIFMRSSFETYHGSDWSAFAEEQPKHAVMYEHLGRESSGYWFVGSLCVLFIIFGAYRRGEKWAWTALLLAGLLACGTFIAYSAIYDDVVGLWLGILGLCVDLVALLIPVKEIWGPKAAQ